jgi:raffinose/stachyose/melibiose transport system permease protein
MAIQREQLAEDAAAGRGLIRRRGLRGREVSATRRMEVRTALLFVAPAFIIYVVFMLFPFLNSIYYSLTSWDGVQNVKEWVGISNYTTMFQDELFLEAAWHNLFWIIFGTIGPVAIGLLLALILWSTPRGALFFRTVYFIPFILPVVVIGIVWGWIYHPLFGGLNSLLSWIGLDSLTRGWLGDPTWALPAVLVAGIWGSFGFVTLVIFAGLQSVSQDLVDAAAIDGANWFQRARYVIIPAIAPVITLVTTITLIGGFAVIDFIIVMTGGGPGTSSEVLGSYAYKNGFQFNQVGYGATVSTFITVLSLVAAVLFVRIRERQRG